MTPHWAISGRQRSWQRGGRGKMVRTMTKTILILAANPQNTTRLRLDQEVRAIGAGLERARRRDEFILVQKLATRPGDVRRAMLEERPNIVHFCGHAMDPEGLAFEGDDDQVNWVGGEALAGFFALFADTLECVVLNACYSEAQAKAIARHIPYVVGMSQAVEDRAAIEFAVAFYDALGAGEEITFAYRLACNAMQWINADGAMPVLLTGPNGGSEQPVAPAQPAATVTPTPVIVRPQTAGNPFFFGGKITRPKNFVGRTAQLRRIFSAFETEEAQHTAIVGERRIGKSSLLYHITQVYTQRLPHPERWRFLYIDLDDPHCHTQPGLLQTILQGLGLPQAAPPTLAQFQDTLSAYQQTHAARPVLCLDEFEHLTRRKPEFPDAFFEAWRSLGNNGRVAFLTASRTPLGELIRQGDLTSNFDNIFSLLRLGELTLPEAQQLLARSADAGQPFTPQECERLLELAGRKAGRLQFAARELYMAKAAGEVDWIQIEDAFARQFPTAAPPVGPIAPVQ